MQGVQPSPDNLARIEVGGHADVAPHVDAICSRSRAPIKAANRSTTWLTSVMRWPTPSTGYALRTRAAVLS